MTTDDNSQHLLSSARRNTLPRASPGDLQPARLSVHDSVDGRRSGHGDIPARCRHLLRPVRHVPHPDLPQRGWLQVRPTARLSRHHCPHVVRIRPSGLLYILYGAQATTDLLVPGTNAFFLLSSPSHFCSHYNYRQLAPPCWQASPLTRPSSAGHGEISCARASSALWRYPR